MASRMTDTMSAPPASAFSRNVRPPSPTIRRVPRCQAPPEPEKRDDSGRRKSPCDQSGGDRSHQDRYRSERRVKAALENRADKNRPDDTVPLIIRRVSESVDTPTRVTVSRKGRT